VGGGHPLLPITWNLGFIDLPKYPGAQRQVNPLMPSKQWPPFMHGLDKHSSMFISQFAPAVAKTGTGSNESSLNQFRFLI
jgi:hypothetical protein